MYSVKDLRVVDTISSGCISGFEDDQKGPELDTTFYSSIGMKPMDSSGKYFSIDFSDASIRKGDHCKTTKTSEMRADEFWEELTAYSKTELANLIQKAKVLGASSILT